MKTSLSPRRAVIGLSLAGAVTLTGMPGQASQLPTSFGLTPATVAMPGKASQLSTAGITFSTKVSTVHGSLPLFRLQRSAAPTSFVSGVLGKTGAMGVENTRLVSRDAHGVLHAYVDGVTGDAEIFPDLSASGARLSPRVSASAAAGAIFARADLIPKDATQTRLGESIPVFAAQVQRAANGATQGQSTPEQLFTYVSAVRLAAGLPVAGAGSQATVAIGNDGAIRGLVRRWQTALPAGTVAATTTPDQLEKAIAAQLHSLQNANTTITVDSVTPAYYDGNAKFLQPVYEFFATLHPRAAVHVANDHVRGYVPVGKLVEPIPVIGQTSGREPAAPNSAKAPATVQPQSSSWQISLGEYANRDGTMQDMANAYYNGFDSAPAWWLPPIVRTQWYWAWPFEVESAANSYLNAVQIAYTMPHGDWWENTTYSNYADFWYINQIGVNGNPGYGAASGGQLATWIIDSCEVIPSYYDLQVSNGNGYLAFNYWWPVFKGLHRALGFRTEMLLGEDAMNYNIARSMAQGANANSAFFNGVAATNFAQYGTYPDYHLRNLQVHYDRASAMYDPRNANESIYSVQGQSASTQLSNVWMGN